MTSVKSHKVKAGAVALALTLFFALGLSVATRQFTDPFEGQAVTDPPFTSLTYGVQAFLWWDETWAGVNLDWIRTMVFSHVKQTFAWEDLEPVRGQWNFTRADEILDEIERRNLELVARLSNVPDWALPAGQTSAYIDGPPARLEDWANYCTSVASRYRGRIDAYQIWNEPNLAREWGARPPNAQEYVELLRVCSQAIRSADPEAILISAGLATTGTHTDEAHPDDSYLQALYDSGFQHYVDVVGVHAPGYSSPEVSPSEAQQNGKLAWQTFRWVEELRRIMVANGDAARQMAVLEFGWPIHSGGLHPDYDWFAVQDESEQAHNAVAAYQYAAENWRPWVGLMSVIYVADPAWTPQDEEYWWAITWAEGYPRQAYVDLANMAKYCGDRIIPQRAGDSPEALGLVTVTPCS